MKTKYLLLSPLIILAITLTACHKSTVKRETTDTINHNPPKYNFQNRRQWALGTSAQDLGLKLPQKEQIVYGVVMDWGINDSITVSLIAFKTGDASIYTNSGYGVTDGGKHPNIHTATKKFINLAQHYLAKAKKTEATPLAKKGEVTFYLLTNKGIFMGKDKIKNFDATRSVWLDLFESGSNLMSELKLNTEKK